MRARTSRWAALVAGVLLAGAAAAVPLQASADSGRAAGDRPPQVLDRDRKGRDALQYVAARRDEVAKLNGLAGDRLADLLENDDTTWLDRSGRLYFAEPQMAPAAGQAAVTAAAPYPDSQTFLLHSRPGALRVIYLDFNGHVVSNSAWNGGVGFTASPFDLDGNTASLSASEITAIQVAWQRISEDYAPFGIDVTTEEPDPSAIGRSTSSDTTYGTRLVITGRNNPLYSSCGCGGIAYLNAFDDVGSTHDYYQPAFVFVGSSYDGKSIAEAGSHEVGHNLGLNHDGTASVGYYEGQGAWAPIMGVGYYRPVSQWSKGEYSGANNTEDDLAVMASHGATPVADDHGDLRTSATALTAPTLSASGLIGTRTDVDFFSFNAGAGALTVDVNPAPAGPNLDVRLELQGADGTVLTSSDPAVAMVDARTATGLNASISYTLPSAGTYYLKVDGVGYGTSTTGYTDYASLGRYTLSGTAPAASTNAKPVAVIGATPTSGTAPLTVAFSSAGSNDPDGTITAYAWDFGDGTTSSAANPSKTYSTPGSYTARLTVTDNQSATGTATIGITVNQTTQNVIRVESIAMSVVSNGRGAQARVTVTDTSGRLRSGVAVRGTWSGSVSGTASGVTGTNGVVTFSSPLLRRAPGTFTFTVTSLSATGIAYDATKNKITTNTISS